MDFFDIDSREIRANFFIFSPAFIYRKVTDGQTDLIANNHDIYI